VTYRIEAVTEDDWSVLREIRLRALADAPTSFGSTLAREQAFAEPAWRERARGTATSRLFVAWAGEASVGIAGVFDEGDGSVQIVSVWVDPAHRRQGLARELTATALCFTAASGLAIARLWVTDGNTGARTLYEALGFTSTGKVQPLPSNPALNERELQLELTASPDNRQAGP
jgi:ribosomal protein S18 acetylase RimI-like enzyme